MKPEYAHFKKGSEGEDKTSFTFRLPKGLYEDVKILANLEGDNVASLAVEGLARVLLDRASDPNYVRLVESTLEFRSQFGSLSGNGDAVTDKEKFDHIKGTYGFRELPEQS